MTQAMQTQLQWAWADGYLRIWQADRGEAHVAGLGGAACGPVVDHLQALKAEGRDTQEFLWGLFIAAQLAEQSAITFECVRPARPVMLHIHSASSDDVLAFKGFLRGLP